MKRVLFNLGAAVLTLAIFAGLTGCGKKGDLAPPPGYEQGH